MCDHEADDADLAGLFDEFVETLQDGIEIDLETAIAQHAQCSADAERIRSLRDLALELARSRSTAAPQFDGYEILDELGSGAMGTVYLARDQELGRRVAIKVLAPSLASSPRARECFRAEARALAALRHEHIVTVHEIVDLGDLVGYVMEWVEGHSLRARLDSCSGTPPEMTRDEVLTIGVSIARALAEAHAAGVVHRDVKPANIVLRRDGCAVLVDFGLASHSEAPRAAGFVGTRAYAAPEQAIGDAEVDGRADVFALGRTLLEALALTSGTLAARNRARELLRSREPVQQLLRGLDRDVSAVLAKAMAGDRASRYATAGAFADDLERVRDRRVPVARPLGPLHRIVRVARRRPALIGATLLLAGVGAVLATSRFADARVKRALELVRDARATLLTQDRGQHAWVQFTRGEFPPPPRLEASAPAYQSALALYESAAALSELSARVALEHAVVHAVVSLGKTTDLQNLSPELSSERMPLTASAIAQIAAGRRHVGVDKVALETASSRDRTALGLVAYLVGQTRLCELAWNRLDPIAEDLPLVDAALGMLLQEDGRAAAAFQRLARAGLSFPDNAWIALSLADAALGIGRPDVAEHWLDRAAQLRPPGEAPSHRWRRVRADLWSWRGDVQRARDTYVDLIAVDPMNPTHALRLAELDAAAGDSAAAVARLGQLVAGAPHVTRARLALARAAAQSGDAGILLDQVRYVVGDRYGVHRSVGAQRDLAEILRIAGCRRLFGEAIRTTGLQLPPEERAFFPSGPADSAADSSSGVLEALAERLGRFDAMRDALPVADCDEQVRAAASVLSLALRIVHGFPEVALMSAHRFPFPFVSYCTEALTCAAWPVLSRRVLPVALVLVGAAPAVPAQSVIVGPRTYAVREWRVNTSNNGLEDVPNVAILTNGEIVAGWDSAQPTNCYGQRYDANGTAIGGEFWLNPCQTGGWEYGPAIAPLPGGGFAVAWGRNSATIHLQIFGPDASRIGCDQIVTYENVWPTISSAANGDFVVAWGRFGDGVDRVGARRYRADGTPYGPAWTVNSQPLGFSSRALVLASVGMAPDGSFCVAWQHGSGDVHAQLYDPAGLPVGTEFAANSSSGGNRAGPSVTFTSGNDLVVGWDDDNGHIFARWFSMTGLPRGPETKVDQSTMGGQYRPSVAAGADGETLIAWTGPDASGGGVFARLYDAAGQPVGDQFAVNRFVSGGQGTTWASGRKSCAIGDRTLLFIWHGSGPGDDSGVFLTELRLVHETIGEGCAGSAGVPTMSVNQPATIGDPYSVVLTNLPTNRPGAMFLGFSRQDLDLSLLGMPDCRLVVTPSATFPIAALGNSAFWGFVVPNQQDLIGGSFFVQAAVIDPPSNPTGVVLSNGIRNEIR